MYINYNRAIYMYALCVQLLVDEHSEGVLTVASSTDALVTSTKSVFHHSRECHFVVSQFNHEFVLIVIKVLLSIYVYITVFLLVLF